MSSSAVAAQTTEAPVPPVQVADIDMLAKAAAAAFSVNEIHFDKTMECESNGLDTAVGDHGLAYGVLQFHRATFDWMKQDAIKQGEPFQNLQYKNPQDQLTLGAWAFSMGMEDNWSCYGIMKAKDWQ